MTDPEIDPALWERHADWWQREFTDGADAEYEEQIIPLVLEHLEGRRRVLDIGCGEGQVARRIAAAAAQVIGVDSTHAQIDVAVSRGGGPTYALSAAEALPFADGVFDAAVMCLVIEHVLDHEAVLAEAARVLAPGGVLLLLLNHPLLQTPGSGWIDDHILGEQYWRVGAYLTPDVRDEEVAPGVVLPFVHRPLSTYVKTFRRLGMVVVDLEEPAPPPGFLAEAWEYGEAASIPRLMLLRGERRA